VPRLSGGPWAESRAAYGKPLSPPHVPKPIASNWKNPVTTATASIPMIAATAVAVRERVDRMWARTPLLTIGHQR
jgi:hypothetical protein